MKLGARRTSMDSSMVKAWFEIYCNGTVRGCCPAGAFQGRGIPGEGQTRGGAIQGRGNCEGPSSEGPSSEGPSSEGPYSEGPYSEGPYSEGEGEGGGG